jgi:hypothetical protein
LSISEIAESEGLRRHMPRNCGHSPESRPGSRRYVAAAEGVTLAKRADQTS